MTKYYIYTYIVIVKDLKLFLGHWDALGEVKVTMVLNQNHLPPKVHHLAVLHQGGPGK